jgi:hypothetical protein
MPFRHRGRGKKYPAPSIANATGLFFGREGKLNKRSKQDKTGVDPKKVL